MLKELKKAVMTVFHQIVSIEIDRNYKNEQRGNSGMEK